jgi:8-oxo-dGTP pyrophosphatase MutT (NUDIX family)
MIHDPLQPDDPDQRFTKAGAVLHGRDWRGEHMLVVPYTQGRFHDEYHNYLYAKYEQGIEQDYNKYYSLPKGGINPGESVLDAAIRETHEETGIDIARLLGEDMLVKFRHGKTIRDFRSVGYPGVTVLLADPVPYAHRYESRTGKDKHTALFNLEIDGIDALRPHLKNRDQRERVEEGVRKEPHVRHTVQQILATRDKPVPTLDTYLEWLRNGAIPPDGSGSNLPARDPRHRAMYCLLNGAEPVQFSPEPPMLNPWFSALEHRYALEGMIASRDDWLRFLKALPKHEVKSLQRCFAAIESYLKGAGIVGDDHDVVKFDEDSLHFYQEGADIASFARFFRHGLVMAELNDDYRHAFTGDCGSLRHLSRAEQVEQAQIAAVAFAATPRDIRQGIKSYQYEIGRRLPHLRPCDAYQDPEYQLREPLLSVREQQHASHDGWTQRLIDAGTLSSLRR